LKNQSRHLTTHKIVNKCVQILAIKRKYKNKLMKARDIC